MATPLLAHVTVADEAMAREIAQEAHNIRDAQDAQHTSTYISTFVSEFLDDVSTIIRTLRASHNSTTVASQRLAQTLSWREEHKVYPAKRSTDAKSLLADAQGRLVVRARQASVLPRPRRQGMASPAAAAAAADGWKDFARGVETLEDARLALKAVCQESGCIVPVAVIVPVESVSLAEISAEELRGLVEVAEQHYPGVVGHLYITANSTVMLEHARQALRPVLAQLVGSGFKERGMDNVDFVLAGALASTLTPWTQWLAAAQRMQAPCSTLPTAAAPAINGRLLLDAFVKCSASSVAHSEADVDFHSAYSEAHETHYIGDEYLRRSASRLSNYTAHDSAGFFMSARGPTEEPGSAMVQRERRASRNAASGLRHMAAARDIVGSDGGGSSSNSDDGSEGSGSRSVTPIQLASLQRAVQSVQRMLGSINDSISSADSRSALAATKSKLVQQADVLMSTVAALNFGVTMMDPSNTTVIAQKNPTAAYYIATAASDSRAVETNSKTSILYKLGLQLLALPLGVMFGRSGNSVLAAIRHLLVRTMRLAVRRLRAVPAMSTLMLLAYKHLRIYAMLFWTGALLIWQANAAIIWSNLMAQWRRGISF
ncbi:hypothetical protein GGI07_005193 [Coemansia sp. Benny D115]|nr:hypothetical protein GGI07_005193 [Coemansia sp. Benny D115]